MLNLVLLHTVPYKVTNRPPLSFPMLTHGFLLRYFEISDESENTDVCKRMVVHEFVLFETQTSATMLNTFEMLMWQN